MLERETRKELLRENYEDQRKRAEELKEQGELQKAARRYTTAASLLAEIATLETSDHLTERWERLAEKYERLGAALANGRDPTREDSSSARAESHEDGSSGATGSEATAESSPTRFLESPPALCFEDVGGMSELKETLRDSVIDPLERSDLYEQYDLGVVNGLLLYGPPGTGKTYIARALAGELEYNFIEVTPTEVTSSLVGEAADNVAALFETAMESQPCLVFIDEIDAIAGQRAGGSQKTQSERQMVNQLLVELSEIQGEDIVVVAATNRLEEVDDAIKRSGRFDERIEVNIPDETAREAILRVHLRDRPVVFDDIDWEAVRERTSGYTASDIELIASRAARHALQETRECDELQHITHEHVNRAIEETEPSV